MRIFEKLDKPKATIAFIFFLIILCVCLVLSDEKTLKEDNINLATKDEKLIEKNTSNSMAAYEAYQQKKKADLDEHFGDITLSDEEIHEAAKQFVGGEEYDELIAQADEFKKLRETFKTIKDNAEELENVSWKLSMGLELDDGDKSEYKDGVESLIEDSVDLLEKEAKASMSLYEEDSIGYNKMKDFYTGKIDEMQKLSEQLKETLNNAFEDGLLTIDEDKKIQELKDQLINLLDEVIH